jgi:hypothetical protein
LTKLFDVLGVDRQPPHRVMLMATWKGETTAKGFAALCTERLDTDDKMFLLVPSASYATGDRYKESLSMSPELNIFTDRPTGMKCGTLHAAARPTEERLCTMAEEYGLDRLAVVGHDGKQLGETVQRTKLMPRHFA